MPARGLQGRALTRVAEALARAEHYQQAEAIARSMTGARQHWHGVGEIVAALARAGQYLAHRQARQETYRTATGRNLPHCFSIPRADLATCMLKLLDDPAARAQARLHRQLATVIVGRPATGSGALAAGRTPGHGSTSIRAGDQVETIDRLFLLQYAGGLLYVPRTAGIAAALSDAQAEGTWFLIRADSPVTAFSHQRQLLADVPGHATDRQCKACPVDTIGSGSLPRMLSQAASLGADVAPGPVPDVRVTMSRMPRCNRILGNGAWDIPAD